MKAQELADKLHFASKNMQTISPLRTLVEEPSIDLAYEVQEINTIRRVDAGAKIIGKKIGLTSFAVQKQLGVSEPDFGVLFNDMEILNGYPVNLNTFLQGKAEAEIAFVLGEDLDYENLTSLDVLSAIDFALPAIEIVGSRIQDWDIKLFDTVADNASASHFVLGHTPKTLDEFDVVNCRMKMYANKDLVSEGSGSACMGSPLNAVLWLAKEMVRRDQALQAGDLILSGALGKMYNLDSSAEVHAEIEGLGSVSFFTEA